MVIIDLNFSEDAIAAEKVIGGGNKKMEIKQKVSSKLDSMKAKLKKAASAASKITAKGSRVDIKLDSPVKDITVVSGAATNNISVSSD